MNFDYSLTPGSILEKQDELKGNKNPTISIITPFYSGHEYIRNVANCVLNQTYPFFEWLIISDGKDDLETKKILSEIESLDDRIKVFYKENGGLAHTRDYGAKKASNDTKYFVFLDDDDLIDKTYLECAYLTLETNKDASFAYTDVVGFGFTNYLWPRWFTIKEQIQSNMLVATSMIRKKDFFEVGGYGLSEKGINEDYIFWLKLFSKGKYPVKMSYYGFWYRRKETGELSLSRQKKNIKRTKELIKQNVDLKKIDMNLQAIQYPFSNYNWNDVVCASLEDFTLPYYEDNGKIKILMIIPWMTMGGADKFNVDLIERIDKNKYEIIVVTTVPNNNPWRQKIEQHAKVVYDLTSFIDIKYWHSFIEYLIKSRNINIIFNTNSQLGYSMLPYLKFKFPEIPIIDYIHMEEWYNRNGGYSRDSSAYSIAIDKTFTCNKRSADILVDYFHRKKDEIGTIYIGVDEKIFDIKNYDVDSLRKKYNVTDDKFVINYVCRIANQKRPMLFIKIMKELKSRTDDFICLVAGTGNMLNDIMKLSKEYNLDNNIRFLGSVDKPAEIYAISDVSLNCSIKEGLALTSYESIAMGTPVVSSDVGGQRELIDSSVGAIVPCLQKECDINDYDYSMDEIMPYVDELLKIKDNKGKYREACRNKILNGFTIDQMVKNMEDVFSSSIDMNTKKVSVADEKILLEIINLAYLSNYNEYSYLCNEFNIDRYCSEAYKNGWTTSKVKLFFIKIIKKLGLKDVAKAFIVILKDILEFFKVIIRKIIRVFKKK